MNTLIVNPIFALKRFVLDAIALRLFDSVLLLSLVIYYAVDIMRRRFMLVAYPITRLRMISGASLRAVVL